VGTGDVLRRDQALGRWVSVHPRRGRHSPTEAKGKIPSLAEVYDEFAEVPINAEIKGERPGNEEAAWRVIESAEERTIMVSESTPTIRRFHEASCGLVATASSSAKLISFYLLSRLGLGRLASPCYQALQGPETYYGLHVVTPGFVRVAHEQGLRVDVWTSTPNPTCAACLATEWTASLPAGHLD
jgi:glycerophosphoryl diester phosphodiesterase